MASNYAFHRTRKSGAPVKAALNKKQKTDQNGKEI
jgi:hypothetical protein